MRRVRYNDIAPADSFIGRYMSAVANVETALAYDFWCAMWCLSTAMGRDIIVARPFAPVHLNIYMMLVAQSGVTRKSTAVSFANKVVRAFLEQRGKNDILTVETRATPEKLESRMAAYTKVHGHCQTVICVSELIRFMGRQGYNMGMPGLLTDLYDCPAIQSGGGTLEHTFELRNVYVTFATASTPSWLAKAINPVVIEGGFTSRCLFIVSETRKRSIAWPEHDDGRKDSINDLSKSLGQIRDKPLATEIHINENAKATFEKWYQTRKTNIDPFKSSFESREDAHVLRVAGLLCINDGSWIIQNTHIINAIHLISEVKEDAANLFEGTFHLSDTAIIVDRVRSVLIAAGQNPVSQSDITRSLSRRASAGTVSIVLDIMHELEMVKKFENVQLHKTGRPVTLWVATKNISSKLAGEELLRRMSE